MVVGGAGVEAVCGCFDGGGFEGSAERRRVEIGSQAYEAVGVTFERKWAFHHQGHNSAEEAELARSVAEEKMRRRAEARSVRGRALPGSAKEPG